MHELVWSKLIVSLVWFLATALLIFLVLSLTAVNLSATNLEMIIEGFPKWSEIRSFLAENGILGQVNMLVFQCILGVLLATLVTCLHFYASMALGHMFSKSKILLSIVFFVGISFLFNLTEMGYGIVGFSVTDPTGWDSFSNVEGLRFMSAVLWHGIALGAVQGAILYLATVLGLKRGLNLE